MKTDRATAGNSRSKKNAPSPAVLATDYGAIASGVFDCHFMSQVGGSTAFRIGLKSGLGWLEKYKTQRVLVKRRNGRWVVQRWQNDPAKLLSEAYSDNTSGLRNAYDRVSGDG